VANVASLNNLLHRIVTIFYICGLVAVTGLSMLFEAFEEKLIALGFLGIHCFLCVFSAEFFSSGIFLTSSSVGIDLLFYLRVNILEPVHRVRRDSCRFTLTTFGIFCL
jgi:hypothetical protein